MSSAITGVIFILACSPFVLAAQSESPTDSISGISTKLSNKYIHEVGERSAECQVKMEKSTEKYLNSLKTKELILREQLNKIDSGAANRIFNNTRESYDKIQNELKSNSENVLKSCGRYFPGVDSSITSLKFLQQNENLTGKLGENAIQIRSALSKVKSLEDQFKKTDNVEEFVKQREEYLKQQLSSYNLPGLQKYNQEAAYYAQQMNELKEAWDDPSKTEQKAILILNKIPAFKEFMQKNSLIAGLFNLPDDYGVSGIGGLQTREMVQQAMQQQIASLGPGGALNVQQNIGDAQSALSDLRTKLNQGSSELAMPAGQGNNQHTKSLFKRIEYGINIQTSRSNLYFPSQTMFALTAGYKLNDRNTLGIGMSYNVGWGKDIQHISVTSQGVGFRSWGDFKIKGSFYGTGGFEYNYAYPFNSITQLRSSGLWQKSGLIGITKMVSLRSNIVKRTKLQLLWNFLSYYQSPQTQPIVFRVGYNF